VGTCYQVRTPKPAGHELTMAADDVIAATGFTTPLRDLPAMGVATFGQSRLPAQTPFWESATVPGIFFAGTITQGSAGLKKHGVPSNSGAVQGYRYNARVLARHLAEVTLGGTHVPTRRASSTWIGITELTTKGSCRWRTSSMPAVATPSPSPWNRTAATIRIRPCISAATDRSASIRCRRIHSSISKAPSTR